MNHCLGLGGTLRLATMQSDLVLSALSECIDNIAAATDLFGLSDNDGVFSQASPRESRA